MTKFLLKIIQVGITAKINKEVSELQSGFRSGMGIWKGIFNLRSIFDMALEVGKEVYLCFIDYTKAFDWVKHSKMIECLKEIGVDDTELQIITKLYWEQSVVVRTESGLTAECKIKKGAWQGCVLSSSLFNLYTEKIFKDVQDMKGVIIVGMKLNNLRYAYDTVLLCFCPTDLQELLNAVNKAGKPYGMEMNIIKTKAMVVSKTTPTPKIDIALEGKPVQQTDKMIYLGSLKTEYGKCENEIRRRIELARSAFEKNVKGTNFKNYQHTNKKKSITVLHMVNITLWFRNMDTGKDNSKQTRSIWNVDWAQK